MLPGIEIPNYELFREIISTPLIEKCSSATELPKARQKRKSRANGTTVGQEDISSNGEVNDAEELAEFIDYLALEIFTSLPQSLRSLTYTTFINTPALQKAYSSPLTLSTTTSLLNALPQSTIDSLTTYHLLPSPLKTNSLTAEEFLHPVLANFIDNLTATPPPPSQTKSSATGCEICDRSHIPLTYHHLIPRSMHEKALKRKWHTQDELGNVAWLCRSCHSFVHGLAGNEVLARDLYTVERLWEREEVRRWASWVGKIRWRKK